MPTIEIRHIGKPNRLNAPFKVLAGEVSNVLAMTRGSEAEILVTVKAYPNISQKYGEVVCVAGVRVDVDPPRWVRLFPVHFRDLPKVQQFSKYDVIRLEVFPHSTDVRPETVKPNVESIEVVGHLDSGRGWADRKTLILPLADSSMCQIQESQKTQGTSLGLFQPERVTEFVWDQQDEEWDPRKQSVLDQPSLLYPDKKGLIKIPFRFIYRYFCEPGCRGHKQSILDWELSQAFIKWRRLYGLESCLERLRARWLDEICGPEQDTWFFVGNQVKRQRQFMVLGTFWPPKGGRPRSKDPALEPPQLLLAGDTDQRPPPDRESRSAGP